MVLLLLTVLDDLSKTLDASGQSDVIYLDFSKAFDSVSHRLLIHKLKKFGITGPLLKWFSSYLSGRTQRVVIEGSSSPWLPVISGVPQGSILGPMLFLLYIDDITECISDGSSIYLFADDAKVYRPINSIFDCILLQADLSSLEKWSEVWKLNFNASKCKIMSVCRTYVHKYLYHLNGIILDRISEFNDLGIIVSSDLSFNSHIRNKIAKGSQILGMIKRATGYNAPIKVKKMFYTSLVRSSIMYGFVIWSINKSDMVLLESL